jgi:hypothetical protein
MAGITLGLPHTPPGARRHSASDSPWSSPYGSALRQLLSDPDYLTLLAAHFCVAASFSILTFYSFPLLEQLGMARHWLGPAQALGLVFEWALFLGQAALLRRWNYTGVILAGCAALLLRHVLYAAVDDLWILSLSYVLVGPVVAFNFVGTSLLVNAIAGSQVRATAQTLLVLFGSGLGPTLANWAAGRIALRFQNSLRPVFVLAALLAGVAMALIALRGRQLNHAGRHHR